MGKNEVLSLAEQALAAVLKRAVENQGRVTPEDAAAASLFCRVVEAESGSAYPYFSTAGFKDWDGALAHAASATGTVAA